MTLHNSPRVPLTPKSSGWKEIKAYMQDRAVGPDSPLWSSFGGAIENVPLLPARTLDFLQGPCPIRKNGELAKNTHFLTLVPASFQGERYSIAAMHQHLSRYVVSGAAQDRRSLEVFMSDHGNLWIDDPDTDFEARAIAQTSWVLQYEGRLPGTVGESMQRSLEVLAQYPLYRQALFMELVGSMALQRAQNNQLLFGEERAMSKEQEGEYVLGAENNLHSGILPYRIALSRIGKRKSDGLAVVVDLSKLA